MILPVKYLWEQLDGPQITAISDAIFQYWKEMFDDKLDYLNEFNVNQASDEHLTLLGIIANFVRPVIEVPDRDYFFLTEDPEHNNAHGLSDVNNRVLGGRLTDVVAGMGMAAHPLNAEYYRQLLKAFIEGHGELGSLQLLDDICFNLSELDLPRTAPFYKFSFVKEATLDRAPGDLYIDIGTLDDWSNPLDVYAVLRGVADSTYAPLPHVLISIDTAMSVPTPTASLPSGTYSVGTRIALSCTMSGAVIYYTTNGRDPTVEDNIYENPIELSMPMSLKFKAVAPGYTDSPVVTESYGIIE